MSNTQINLLKAIMKGEEQYTATATMQNYGLGTPDNVRKNLLVLQDLDLVNRHQGSYQFLDSVFKNWMERIYG